MITHVQTLQELLPRLKAIMHAPQDEDNSMRRKILG
jgi:hypothetical protein